MCSQTTARWRPVEVHPNVIGSPLVLLSTVAFLGLVSTSSASSFVTSCARRCCTFPSGSSFKSQKIVAYLIDHPGGTFVRQPPVDSWYAGCSKSQHIPVACRPARTMPQTDRLSLVNSACSF